MALRCRWAAVVHTINRALALAVSRPWRQHNGRLMVSAGHEGFNDGWTDLLGRGGDPVCAAGNGAMDCTYESAIGNVAQMGWIDLGSGGASSAFDLVLGFGANQGEAAAAATGVLAGDVGAIARSYDDAWHAYVKRLAPADGQAVLAAMVLKTAQDKSNGAMVAGLGVPWGDSLKEEPAAPLANGGYHLVWGRDLFKYASALLTAGDSDTALRALEYLLTVQMKPADCGGAACGRLPQNSWINGTPYWNATQMDQQAMPLILAWRLSRIAAARPRVAALWPQLKQLADFIAAHGPVTQQERWEENAGYSPSTMAAEIAGLVCAADLARAAGDAASAGRYVGKADAWRHKLDDWTFTTSGPHGNHRYYVRLTANGRPDGTDQIKIGNGGGWHAEKEVVDGGFLELVRLGVLGANALSVLETMPEYDAVLKRDIGGHPAWFRYNYDGYGERNDGAAYDAATGRGRLWPIFTAERGLYEIARQGSGTAGEPYRKALLAFATPTGLIPEQIWSPTTSVTGWDTMLPAGRTVGAPTGSMTPLNWAMGEYITLQAAIRAGRLVDVPAVVCERYHTCVVPPQPGQAAAVLSVTAQTQYGELVYVAGDAPELGGWVPELAIPLDPALYPSWSQVINLPAGRSIEYKYFRRNRDGSVTWEAYGNRRLVTPQAGGLVVGDSVTWP